uniref:Uncharacterized protein n=1 Tax=Oryza brachyantha TaxID=4533 RepID=J3ND65_ORYBR
MTRTAAARSSQRQVSTDTGCGIRSDTKEIGFWALRRGWKAFSFSHMISRYSFSFLIKGITPFF